LSLKCIKSYNDVGVTVEAGPKKLEQSVDAPLSLEVARIARRQLSALHASLSSSKTAEAALTAKKRRVE